MDFKISLLEISKFKNPILLITIHSMKFKARLEKEQVLQLHSVITSLEKIGSRAAFFLSEESIRISVIPDNLDSLRCFCELPVNDLFFEYRISSNNDNSILFECSLSFILKSLGSGKTASECVVKLVKRGDVPCLCIEAKASGGLTVDIVHDIPIKLQKVTDLVHYLPPDVPPPSVALSLTRVKLMRSVIDRMSKLARTIQMTAHQVGRLAFKVDGLCQVSSYVTGLTPCYEGTPMDEENDRNNISSVSVDNRKLAALFGISHLLTHHALLCKCDFSATLLLFFQFAYFFIGLLIIMFCFPCRILIQSCRSNRRWWCTYADWSAQRAR